MEDKSAGVPSPLSPGVESRPGLLRVLGPGMAMAMVVGNVIGSGIFFKPGEIATNAGSFPMIISAWVLGGVICILGGLCFAELAVMLPRAGGLYVYLKEAYGLTVAFLFGWSEFLFGRPASIGALSVVFVSTLSSVIGIELGTWSGIVLALIMIFFMAWVNVVGAIWGGRVQAGTTLIKASFLGVLAVLPFCVSMAGYEGVDLANYTSKIDPAQKSWATQFAMTMLAVMWAYNGWHGITPVAEEVRDPQRNIPRALFGGIGLLIVLYVGANLAYHGVLSMQEMADAGEGAAQKTVQAVLSNWGDKVAQWGVAAMSAVIMCSLFGAINSNIMNGPRISFAMGRDDVFFRGLGRVHVIYRTPATAIVVMSGMSALLVISSGMLVEYVESFRDKDIFQMLTDYVVFSASIFYCLAVFAVFILRKKHPEWPRAYRTWGYPVVPAVYICFYLWFLFYVFNGKAFEAITGMVFILLGLPFYWGWKRWAANHPENLSDGI